MCKYLDFERNEKKTAGFMERHLKWIAEALGVREKIHKFRCIVLGNLYLHKHI